jgi:hypothetical protein
MEEDAKTQHNCLCFTYKTQERVAFTLLAIHEIILGENDAVFLINTFFREREDFFEEQCSMSSGLSVMMALNLKQISI